jgi:hypothetical protein
MSADSWPASQQLVLYVLHETHALHLELNLGACEP